MCDCLGGLQSLAYLFRVGELQVLEDRQCFPPGCAGGYMKGIQMRISNTRRIRFLGAAIVLLTPAASIIATSATAQAATCNSNAYGSWADNCTVLSGSEGGLVIGVQQITNNWGSCGSIAVDGDFGQQTYTAVKCYQEDHFLSVDGEVGPQTWTAMYDSLDFITQGSWKYYGLPATPSVQSFRELVSTGEWETRNSAGAWVQM